MRKVIKGIVILGFFSIHGYAREVTVCSAYSVGARAQMDCSGGINTRTTMEDLYASGWRYIGNISGGHKFILLFEK